jgi:hypothetical protein
VLPYLEAVSVVVALAASWQLTVELIELIAAAFDLEVDYATAPQEAPTAAALAQVIEIAFEQPAAPEDPIARAVLAVEVGLVGVEAVAEEAAEGVELAVLLGVPVEEAAELAAVDLPGAVVAELELLAVAALFQG